jgi:hypothetical protein
VIVARSIFGSVLSRPARAIVPVCVGAGVLVLWFAFASAAPAADTDLTAAALEARKAVGLPAVDASAPVRGAARVVLDGGDPQQAFAQLGGTGHLVTATVPAGGALSNAKLKVILFDPRVTAIGLVGRDGRVGVAAVLDPGGSFPTPILAGAVFDPGIPGSLAVLFPPGSGTIPAISLQRYRGSQLCTIELAATAAPGLEGAILVGLKGRDRVTGPQVGYGLTYTLRIGTGKSYTVRTRPTPTELVARSFAAGPGFAGADRGRFLKAVAALPPDARKIVDVIGGAITVSILADSSPICRMQTSCAGFDPGNGYFMIVNRNQLRSRSGKFVISHELGHLVDFLGLDTFSHEDFGGLFSKSSKWKSCFPVLGTCAPSLEVFADQFAFYSTNYVNFRPGYGDPRLATSSAFATILQAQWAYRPPQELNPLAGFGPLATSFEMALRSSQGAL